MFKTKAARITGFVGTLGLSATLLGAAASTTGAYFTDSEPGTVAASAGSLTLDRRSDYNLSFDRLIPGEYKSREVVYRTGGDAATDIWLKFPAGLNYLAFTGDKGNAQHPAGGLGRYGHFAVADNGGGTLFSSYNLTNESAGVSGCADANGHGSGRQATSPTDTPPYCGVPQYIKLESNVAPGSELKSTLTFGVTGRWKTQGVPVANLPFEVVATQVGVRPDAEHF